MSSVIQYVQLNKQPYPNDGLIKSVDLPLSRINIDLRLINSIIKISANRITGEAIKLLTDK